MTWRDDFRPATFRGVAFEALDVSHSGGRRLTVDEYPQRDAHTVDDMGRSAPRFSMQGFVAGEDYRTVRDDLIAACEEHGAGTLVHPWRGKLSVHVEAYDVSESSEEGGMARFALTFVDASTKSPLVVTVDTITAATTAAEAMKEAASDAFADTFATSGSPAFVLADATAGVESFASDLRDAAKAPGSTAAATVDELGDLAEALSELETDAQTLAGTPAALAARLESALEMMVGLDVVQALLDSDDTDRDSATATTEGEEQSRQNAIAMSAFRTQVALAQAAVIVTDETFDSVQEVERWRDYLADAFQDEIAATADAYTFQALQDLKAAAINDLEARAAKLPEETTTTPNDVMPALVLAYDLYGDATRDEEIALRNDVEHPGFLPPAPLRVLAS